MIPNQWYAVLDSREVAPGKAIGVTRLGQKMVIWRDHSSQVGCALDRCPHRGAALSAGEVIDGHIACPFHGFEFDSTGHCVLIPANGKEAPVPQAFTVKAYPAREAHSFIWVWNGEPREQAADYPPIRFFDDIDDSFSYGTHPVHWATHYSRAIENQLDVVHLPFVHRKTIGRSRKTVVNGPPTVLDDDGSIRVWVRNEQDTGQTPRKPSECKLPPDGPYQLCFIFPNVWENRISDDLRVMIAFAPVDDKNTIMYLRFYQRFMKVPVLRDVVSWLGARANNIVASEDQPVVETQRPYRPDLDIGEKLIPGDMPIIKYRQQRRQLIQAAAPASVTGREAAR